MSEQAAIPNINFSRILRAAEGLTQWRAMALGFMSFLASALLMVAGTYLAARMGGSGGMLFGAVSGLLAVVIGAAGFSGVGAMLMDRAKGIEQRSMTDALVFGALCLPKFIIFGLILAAVALVIVLVAALVYFLCKLPGLGPLLLFVAHPILVLGAGALFTIVTWVVIPLFTPAVWEGRTLREALATVMALARQRMLPTIVLLLTLYVVVALIGALMWAALLPGYLSMSGLAGMILGSELGSVSAFQIMGMLGGGGGGSYVYAGVLASGVLLLLVGSMLMQVVIMGLNLVYLSASEGLDVAASQAALDAGLEQARKRSQAVQERARQAADRARDAARPAAAAPVLAAAGSAPVAHCGNCGAAHAPGDVFCGGCGQRLA